ncbi:bacillithiol biosynthesis cysteine-adding enzyme BshC [Alicyclobacillus fastidiosus]|uniref:Putative cysteine ligase BshC n=1 Tax=Alicyclobacillus fastidiosus TaxID=392011 RepID=A0ABV5AHL7_9BACL|nr:bacillithiol biosynthesis cysteine-adding enzyme BshC [Alicyclobacillus fastidiosus]WEH08129.1 bacillithiol biosynthesis cysteine-adding enzyme BshC [Alicyclobacillus fastidiosus]
MKCTIHQAPTGNRLTDTHLFNFDQVAHLYDQQNPTNTDTFRTRAETVTQWFDGAHRQALVDSLLGYGARIGQSSVQVEATKRLLDPQSVAVVTGQQAGLVTGPFLSISKALSAIGLASQLECELGRPVVPIFWVASEDHDFGEVDHAYILDELHDVRRIKLAHSFDAHQMVYHGALTEEQVAGVIDELHKSLPELPYKSEVLTTLKNSFEAGDSLSVWFARLMAKLLASHPIVIVDPCLPELRQLVGPVFANTLRSFQTLQENLAHAYEEVEQAGFQHEVVRDERNSTVFYVVEGRRYVLERRDDGNFVTRGLGTVHSLEQLQDVAATHPERFSSNVLLRPVIQDHLIPTLAYVGGPSELAYHPLSRAVFHVHGRKLPPLVMRQRIRIATPPVARTMAQWGISFEDLAKPADLVATHALGDLTTALRAQVTEIEAQFAASIERFVGQFSELGPQVADIAARQVEQQKQLVARLEMKVYRLAERRRSDDVQQLRRIEHWFWTDGHEQERRLSPMNAWAELGTKWFDSLPTWGNYQQPGAYIDLTVD